MEIRYQSAMASHDRVMLSVQADPNASGGLMLNVRKPTARERGESTLLSVISFGLYTRLIERPRQWAALKASLLLHAPTQLSEPQVQQLLETYSRQGHLTAGRLAVIMDDVERACASGIGLAPRSLNQALPLSASQSVVSRAGHSLAERLRRLTAEERALKDLARHEIEAAGQSAAPKDSTQTAAYYRRLYGAESILSVLRPGHTIEGSAVNFGLGSLKPLAMDQDMPYAYARLGNAQSRIDDQFDQALEQMREQGMGSNTSRGLFTMPLAFGGSLLHPENHVVNLTVDFASKKLLYLDSKALPIEIAETYYANGSGLTAMLSQLGSKLWGNDWQLASGLVQLNLPKQQGANDCGAFTHHFTRCLLQGESVGDIERRFSVQDRAHLRVQMADDIARETLTGINQSSPVVSNAIFI